MLRDHQAPESQGPAPLPPIAKIANIPSESLPSSPFLAESDLQRAFHVCKSLESQGRWPGDLARNKSEAIPTRLSAVCVARVLGFGLLHPPSDIGRDNLATEILECNDSHELLADLAHLYVFGFAGLFYDPRAGAPEIFTEEDEEDPVPSTQAAAKPESLCSLTDAELRDLIMTREDGFCPVTGRVDILRGGTKAKWGEMDTVHIINRSLSDGIEGVSEVARRKYDWAETAGGIVEHFGGFPVHDLLGSENLNCPRNAMMLLSTVHVFFGTLQLWLTPFKDANGNVISDKYEVNICRDERNELLRHDATFRSFKLSDGGEIEPPSPQLLAIHASCAKMVHMSGAVEYLWGEI